MTILSILFIFSTLSTLVFKSSVHTRASDLIKLFLTLSSPIISSKSSCSLYVRFSMKSKGPSVKSPSSRCSNKYSLSYLSTSSKRNGASISISFFHHHNLIPCQKYLIVTFFCSFVALFTYFLPVFYFKMLRIGLFWH